MFFNKKDDATPSGKKVNTLAPAFRYPKVKRQEQRESPIFKKFEETASLQVEPNRSFLDSEDLPLLVKPTLSEFPVFSLEDDFFQDQEISATFTGYETLSPQNEWEAQEHFVIEEEAVDFPDFSDPKPSASFLSVDEEPETTYETVLTKDLQAPSVQRAVEEDFSLNTERLTGSHVAKPALEKLTPVDESLAQESRVLAFEDDDHYYNPLAIGEVLPSYTLPEVEADRSAQNQVQSQVPLLDVFDDLEEMDLDLQESFITAQKSSEALEAVFGVNQGIETPPVAFQNQEPSLLEVEQIVEAPDMIEPFEALHQPLEETDFAEPAIEELTLNLNTAEEEQDSYQENTFDFSLFLDENPETVTLSETEEASESNSIEPLEESPSLNTAFMESVDLNEVPPASTLESTFFSLEDSLETLTEANIELSTSGLSTDFDTQIAEANTIDPMDLELFSQEESDLFDALSFDLSAATSDEGLDVLEQAVDLDETALPSEEVHFDHVSIEGETSPEASNTLLDASLFFSLEDLEQGTAPEELAIDLEPLPDFEPSVSTTLEQQLTPVSLDSNTKGLLHPIGLEKEDEFLGYFPQNEQSEALLGEYASLALEDLDILSTQAFPQGQSTLYFVHVNDVYALIALKQYKYTLLQSFSSLPDGVELLEGPEGNALKEGTLQVTWNASSYDEQIFDLRLGRWQALLVEDATKFSLFKTL